MKASYGGSAIWRGWRGIAKRVYVLKSAGGHSVDRPWKRWKRREVWMSGKQGEWWGFVRWNAWGIAWI